MDVNGFTAAFAMVFGIMGLIAVANLVDFGFRTMAENKATRAEHSRFQRWGLPAPTRPEEPQRDEHLWHL